MKGKESYVKDALQILTSLGLPRAQQNERSALSLLALLNISPGKHDPLPGRYRLGD